MSNSNFDKFGLDKSGTHWLPYSRFVVSAFAIYFGWEYFNDSNFHHFVKKNSSFEIVMDITI